ncbi:CIA30 family protein [Loktanella salsilacus]|uniref:CIA30 family protein n=1 Tax=Loktanella salsilacus TaxID=195913 RepID=UPI00345ED79A
MISPGSLAAKGGVDPGATALDHAEHKESAMILNLNWEYVADTVMGGVSRGKITAAVVKGRDAVQLTGQVSLENDGGFIQMAADLPPEVQALGFTGLEVDATGNGEAYDIRLRTTDLTRPWQSYRTAFTPGPDWGSYRLPFAAFEAHRTDAPFNPANLRRLGIVAIGHAFAADVSVAAVRLYRA